MNSSKSYSKILLTLILLLPLLIISLNSLSVYTSGPTIVGRGTSWTNISWTTDQATNYTICYNRTYPVGIQTCSNGPGTTFKTTNSRNFTGLLTDTLYYYKIISWNSTGTRIFRNSTIYNFSTLDNTAPSSPSLYTAKYVFNGARLAANRRLNLSFIAPGDNGILKSVSKYYVAYRNSPINNNSAFNSATKLSLSWTPVPNGTRDTMLVDVSNNINFPNGIYYFAIIAEDDGDSSNTAGIQKLNSSIINASVYIDKKSPNAPILWWNREYYVTNNSNVNIYGYSNESWSEVEIYAQDFEDATMPSNKNKKNITLYNTSFMGNVSVTFSANKGATNIFTQQISNECPEFANTGNSIEFSNHNRSFLRYYTITSSNEDGSNCVVVINTPIEQNVPQGTMAKFYNNSRPHGWFNMTISLHNGKNNISGKTWDYYLNAGIESRKILVVYDNHITPNISKSWIQNQINNGDFIVRFNVTDNGILNISRTNVTVTNFSNLGIKYYLRYPQNITCINKTTYNDSYICSINFSRLPDGMYNVSINVSDKFRNENITNYSPYYKYNAAPLFTSLKDQGSIHSYNDNRTSFYFNWTLIPPNPIILYYNYSIGTASYPNSGWNNIVSWRTFLANNSYVNYTNLGSGNYEAIIDFRACNPVCHPANNNRYYLTIRAITTKNVSNYYSTDGIIFLDDEKPTIPIITINDLFNENFSTSKNYLKFSYSSTDYSGIGNYQIIISNASYTPTDGTTFMLPTNKVYENTVSSTTSTLTLNTLNLKQGEEYFIHVRAKDTNNLWSNFKIKEFSVDTTPANGTKIMLNETITNPYNFRVYSGNDTESGMLWTKLIVTYSNYVNGECNYLYTPYYSQDINPPYPSEANIQITLLQGKCHNFKIQTKNKAGLLQTTYATTIGNKSIPIDITPPSAPTNVMIRSGSGNGVVTNDRLKINFDFTKSSDLESGILKHSYWLQRKDANDIPTNIIGPINTTKTTALISEEIVLSSYNYVLEHGEEYRICVRGYNKFNASESNITCSNYVLYTDITPPSIVSIKVRNVNSSVNIPYYYKNGIKAFNISSTSANITVTLNEENSKCRFSNTRVFYSDMENLAFFWSKTYNFSANKSVNNGFNDVYILCADNQDNQIDIWSAEQIIVYSDTSPPSITINSPINGSTYGNKIQYSVTSSDLSGVYRTWFKLVNKSNFNDIFVDNTTSTSRIIILNSSFNNQIFNATLIVYSNDTRSNLGMKTSNITINTNLPNIVFNTPISNNYPLKNDFVFNMSVENSNNITTKLYYIEGIKTQKITFVNTSSGNKNWNITKTINLNTYSEGKYIFNVVAKNNYTAGSVNINEQNRSFIFDKTAHKYFNVYQTINGIPITSIYNNDSIDNLKVNISAQWYESKTNINTSGIAQINFSIRHEINGINNSWINKTAGTNKFYLLDKDDLVPGSKIYWKSSIRDESGNINTTTVRSFRVNNRAVISNNSLLSDSDDTLYNGNWTTFNLSNYFSELDYGQNILFYFTNLSGAGILDIYFNSTTNLLNVTNFNNVYGTQLVEIKIGDSFSNITQYLKITFSNYTIINITNTDLYSLNLSINTPIYDTTEIKKILDNVNIVEKIAKGITNISHYDGDIFFKISLSDSTNSEITNISIRPEYDMINFDFIELSNLNITNDNAKRYQPILATNLFVENRDFNFTLGKVINSSGNYKAIIFNSSGGAINYTDYVIINAQSTMFDSITPVALAKYLGEYEHLSMIILKDRATTDICGNGIDEDYSGSDFVCPISPPPSGGSSGSSSGGSSGGFIIPVTPKVTINDTEDSKEPELEKPNDNSDKPVNTGSSTKVDEKNTGNSGVIPINDYNSQKSDQTESDSEYIQIDLKPIITIFLFVLLLGTLAIAIIRKKPENGIDKTSIRENLEYLKTIHEQKKNMSHERHMKNNVFDSIKIENIRPDDSNIDERILKYIEFALQNGFGLEDVRKRLIEHGFKKENIDTHISKAKEKNIEIERIRKYLHSRKEDKNNFSKAVSSLERVGWSKEYIQEAVNKVIEEDAEEIEEVKKIIDRQKKDNI